MGNLTCWRVGEACREYFKSKVFRNRGATLRLKTTGFAEFYWREISKCPSISRRNPLCLRSVFRAESTRRDWCRYKLSFEPFLRTFIYCVLTALNFLYVKRLMGWFYFVGADKSFLYFPGLQLHPPTSITLVNVEHRQKRICSQIDKGRKAGKNADSVGHEFFGKI